jgi:zinc transporter ZupT
MNKILSSLAVAGLTAAFAVGPSTKAKADGGAIIVGVGVYLLADALVGRHCHRHEWPFNIVRKVGDELHGSHGCRPHRHHRHHRHHW